MKRQVFFISTILLLCATCGFSQSKVRKEKAIFPFPILQKKLANGLNVVTVPFNSPGIASLYIVIRAGSHEEVEAGKTGFAHFFEHMMFRGTEKYTPDMYNQVLNTLGASANANTSSDRTMYTMTGNAIMLEKMFELEGDRFQNLKYSVHDFKTEAGAVKGEYTKNAASPFSQLQEKIANTAFDKSTYKHTTMGFFTDVVDMPNQYDYSLTFFQRFYRPEYATIIVVGDVKPETVNGYAQKYFGTWKRGNYKPVIEQEPTQQGTRYTHIKQASFPPYLSLNYKGPAFSYTEKDLPALNVLCSILFGETSQLYQELVVKERKARSLFAGAAANRDPNLISIGASLVDVKDMQYVKDRIVHVLEIAKAEAVDLKKLSDTKSNYKYGFAMRMDSPDALAESLGRFTWLTGKPETINAYYALFDKLTVQDLIKVANKYFVTNALTIGTISPDEEVGVK